MSEEELGEVEKKFLKKHWKVVAVFAVLFIAAAIVAIFVFLLFVETAQATGLVPSMLGQWTIGYMITFCLHVVFWELLLVGSWVLVISLVILIQWYKKLPEEERTKWPQRGRREEGDAFEFIFGITWLIVVWVDDRWHLPFESWTFNDWVYSFLSAMFWDLLIFGIPIALYFLWWVRREIIPESE